MTVYLYCEGVTDYAVIPPIMQNTSKISDMDVRWIKRDNLKNIKMHRKSNIIISGHYKLIKALAVFSLLHGSKYIAYHQDADGKYAEVYNSIIFEFKALRESGFHCIAIVPKEMTESWLLADVTAINSISEGSVNQSPNPESLNDPKSYLKENLERLGVESNYDTYTQIAKNSCIDLLKRRCSESFGQFYKDMQLFIIENNSP